PARGMILATGDRSGPPSRNLQPGEPEGSGRTASLGEVKVSRVTVNRSVSAAGSSSQGRSNPVPTDAAPAGCGFDVAVPSPGHADGAAARARAPSPTKAGPLTLAPIHRPPSLR